MRLLLRTSLVATLLSTAVALGGDPVHSSVDVVFATNDDGATVTSDETVVILLPDGSLRVTRNGKLVPPESLKREGERVVITNKDGTEVTEILLSDGDPANPTGSLARRNRGGDMLLGKRKRIGVTMVTVDPALCAQLELEADRVVMIGEVQEGLPASRVGLQKYDIITAVNDREGVTAQTIQEIVQTTSPEQKIRLRVLRRGVPQEAVLEVEEVAEPAPNVPSPFARTVPLLRDRTIRLVDPEWSKASPADLAALGERLRAMELAETAAARAAERAQADASRAAIAALEERFRVEKPTRPAETESNMKRIEERLDRLERLLEKLIEDRHGGVR